MKKVLNIFFILLVACVFYCCEDKGETVVPSDILNPTIDNSQAGKLLLHWEVPQDSAYLYVRIKYYDPNKQKDMVQLVSVYANTFQIPRIDDKGSTLAYGDVVNAGDEYKFTLQTVSSTETVNPNVHTLDSVVQ